MRKLFLLEDDLSLISGLTFAFKKQGFALDTARTLAEAEVLWSDGKYDLLVLDVSLPDGSGFDFCQKVRRTSNVPILFLTASDEEMNIIMGLELGGDDYLTKPFSGRELLARLRVMLRRNRPDREPSVFRLGSIIVDLSSRRVEKGKEEIHLTSKEYGILRLLLLHQGKVMTHRQLLREIWGPQHEEDTHYLRVHIAHLRQKLGDSDPENRIIRAESGLGYRIVADGAE